MTTLPTILTIAGSDPSAGAGIQADMRTAAAHGVYAMTVVSALTAQGPQGVEAVRDAGTFVAAQLSALPQIPVPGAVKTGMLPSAAAVKAVARHMAAMPAVPLVVDPVTLSTSGHTLIRPRAFNAICRLLLPVATLVTPNIAEAELLSGAPVHDPAATARRIAAMYGTRAVLVKGGHLDMPLDTLFDSLTGEVTVFRGTRIDTRNTHGTGCTLSAAIACRLAMGHTLAQAVAGAKAWLAEALRMGSALDFGQHHGPALSIFPKNTFMQ